MHSFSVMSYKLGTARIAINVKGSGQAEVSAQGVQQCIQYLAKWQFPQRVGGICRDEAKDLKPSNLRRKI